MPTDLIAGRYRVEHPVGRGGMGTVWLCHDDMLGRDVAVKQVGTLPGESVPDSARAFREARSSAALNHRNVVSVFDIVEEAGRIWLVMEYVPSRTLGEMVAADGALPPHRVAAIGAQIADGLAAAHALGTIHRDVKPGNILVSEGDLAKIGDFGIARSAGDAQLTSAGLVTGTPAYMAPELARGHDPGAAADVWALGATLYTAVEGTTPYPEQRNPIAMLQTIASQLPPRPRRAGDLTGPITRMMDQDPAARWTMQDAAHALRRLARNMAAPLEPGTSVFATAPAAPAAPATRASAADPSAASTTTGPAHPGSEPARGAAGRTGPSSDRAPGPRRRLRPVPLLLALGLLLLAGTGYALVTVDEDGSPAAGPGRNPAASSPSSASSPSPSPSPSRSVAPDRPPRTQVDPASAKERFVRRYFATVPGDTDTGWTRLAPRMQAVGRGPYEDFWAGVSSVRTDRVAAEAGSTAVEVSLTYTFDNGRVVAEDQLITLQRSGGEYLIADDQVLSSRTVS